LRFAVRDTGIGIAPDDAARLFQPFVQADLSTSRQYGGSGLGLAICKRLVVAMGGDIWLDSAPGRGSTFTFTIRVTPAEALPVGKAAAVQMQDDGRTLEILVADDNETTRYLVSSMLGRLQHRVTAVADGQQALQAASERTFDIVLMDMQMPVMDGAAATRAIRNLPGPMAQVPVIALTADAIAEHHPGFLSAGANTVVVKPVVWRELGAQIDRLVPGAQIAARIDKSPMRHDQLTETKAAPRSGNESGVVLDQTALNDLTATLGVQAVAKMLPTFVTNMVDYRDRMAAAVAAGDLVAAKRVAHALKGLAAQFGAPQVSAIAKTIEQETTSIAEVGGHLSALIGAVAAAAQAIRLQPGMDGGG
jgi:CheY-like chemotaxis protein